MDSLKLRTSVCLSVCLYILSFISEYHAQDSCRSFLTPTSNLREVVISKCTEYQEIVNQPQFCSGNTFNLRNCTEIWETFSQGFLHQPRCNVSETGYEEYINLTYHSTPPGKSLFWENVYPFVHRFSHKGAKYTTLSDTLTGYIGNQLQWCADPMKGMSTAPDMCPEWDPTPDCPQHAVRAFWIAASKSFATRAHGEVQIMLNAKTDPIFKDDTYLAVYELPYLTRTVSKVTVLLLNEDPVPNASKCTDPSLQGLRDILTPKGIGYACVENRRDVALLFCFDNPGSKLCDIPDTNNADNKKPPLLFVAFCITLLLFQEQISNT